jgi:hypothetical protein
MNLNIFGRRRLSLVLIAIITMAVAACSCTVPPPGTGGTTTTSSTTTSSTTTTSTTLPEPTTWEFSLRVGMPAELVTKYGGVDAAKAKVQQQLTYANSRFAGFTKPITWQLNEFFVFTGGALDQLNTPVSSDYQLLYSENTAFDDGGWKPQSRTVVIRWTAAMGGVFGAYGADSLVHELGHARGAIDMYGLIINGANNPISGQSYTPEAGIMTYPYGVATWDSYSTRIINASADTVYNDDRVVRSSIPTVKVLTTKNGAPVNGATVELFGASWFTNSVNGYPSQTGTTTNGTWTIPSNPFDPNPYAFWQLSYGLLLVKVTSGSSVGYAWLTLPDAGNWYFTHPGVAYQLNVNLV